MKTIKRPMAAFTAVVIAGGSLMVLLVSGCSKHDEPPPANSGYYTGPMKSKGSENPVMQKGGAAADTK